MTTAFPTTQAFSLFLAVCRSGLSVGLFVLVALVGTAPWQAQSQENMDRALELFNRGSYTQALQMFRSLASRDVIEAHYQLGQIYAEGDGVPRDLDNAIVFLRRAAIGKHQPAQALLAKLYLEGLAPDLSRAEANRESVDLLRQSADGGNAESALLLATLLRDGPVGVSADLDLSTAYLNQAAEAGIAEAQYLLADHLIRENDPNENSAAYEEAIRLYRLAADAGNADALYNLGVLHFYGRGVTPSDYEAARLFQIAAEIGHGRSQNHLAWMYRFGRGVGQSDAQAAKYYYHSALRGYPDAQNNIAIALVHGRGVDRNYAAAAKFFTLAARQGYSDSVYNLALMYIAGAGVSRNLGTAYKLLEIAVQAGSRRASTRLRQLLRDTEENGISLLADLEETETFIPKELTFDPTTVNGLPSDLPVRERP